VAHQVTVELPLPFHPVVESPAFDARAMEEVALVFCVVDDCRAPPIGPRGYLAIRVQPRVAMPRKGVPVLVRVKLHYQADLARIIQARDPFAFGLGSSQGRQTPPADDGTVR